MDERGLIEEIFKLVGELRANGLKSKLSPPAPEALEPMGEEAVEMPGAEAAEGEASDLDPEMLKQLLESMGGE